MGHPNYAAIDGIFDAYEIGRLRNALQAAYNDVEALSRQAEDNRRLAAREGSAGQALKKLMADKVLKPAGFTHDQAWAILDAYAEEAMRVNARLTNDPFYAELEKRVWPAIDRQWGVSDRLSARERKLVEELTQKLHAVTVSQSEQSFAIYALNGMVNQFLITYPGIPAETRHAVRDEVVRRCKQELPKAQDRGATYYAIWDETVAKHGIEEVLRTHNPGVLLQDVQLLGKLVTQHETAARDAKRELRSAQALLKQAQSTIDAQAQTIEDQAARIRELEAEIARLRDNLEKVVDGAEDMDITVNIYADTLEKLSEGYRAELLSTIRKLPEVQTDDEAERLLMQKQVNILENTFSLVKGLMTERLDRMNPNLPFTQKYLTRAKAVFDFCDAQIGWLVLPPGQRLAADQTELPPGEAMTLDELRAVANDKLRASLWTIVSRLSRTPSSRWKDRADLNDPEALAARPEPITALPAAFVPSAVAQAAAQSAALAMVADAANDSDAAVAESQQ